LELPAQTELSPAWRRIRGELLRTVGESTYEIWLAALEPRSWDGHVLLLDAPAATRAWVSERYGRVLETCVRTVVGAGAQVEFASDHGNRRRAPSTLAIQEHAELDLNPRYTFEQFIIGDGNRMAHAAALTVAEQPGGSYNPLFLYSPPGLGKTHLLHAIGNYILLYGDGATVRYTTVESFTNHFISALNSRSVDVFKHAYRDADVLLIDDVQFLVSKAKTEEEFFHTFNALYDTGRQLVLTCDRIPRQLMGIEERLRERFGSGLVAEIEPPDLTMRVAILRKRAEIDQIPHVEPGVLELIAARVTTNIRSLEGALIQIVAYASLKNSRIDLELAGAVLDRTHPLDRGNGLTIPGIQDAVAAHFGISLDELVSQSRAARVTWPRQVAIQLSRTLTDKSLEQIGSAFGGRNHATVMHAIKRVSTRLVDDANDAATVRELEAVLRASTHSDRRP
jgi:chromosomal replication initiator protein